MKKLGIFLTILLIIICVGIFSISLGNEEISDMQNPEYTLGKVTAKSLKLRSGVSVEHDYISLLENGENVHIYGKVDDWYIVKTENNLVGAVFAEYIEPSYETEETIETSANIETAETVSAPLLSQNEQVFLNLINNKRLENNLPEFEIDAELLNIARLKAQDIAQNNYFSHTSPTYGTFFEMLQNHNISYSKASENIARNINADGATLSFMKSEAHKQNILSEEFNYTGVAVVNSPNWGKIFVQIFVGK